MGKKQRRSGLVGVSRSGFRGRNSQSLAQQRTRRNKWPGSSERTETLERKKHRTKKDRIIKRC